MRRDIHDRAEAYAIRAVKLYQHLERRGGGAASVLGKQYLRVATSIGANLVEAESGESRRDFIHKCSIAQKEARESKYWLRLLLKAELVSAKQVADLVNENEQLIAILTAIIVKTKKGLQARP